MSKTQSDKGLAFNGQGGEGFSRGSSKYSGNQHGGKAGGNYGMGPRVGNKSDEPSGKDAQIICRASEGGPVKGKTDVKKPGNPDRINVGR